MSNQTAALKDVRRHAQHLLKSIGVSRIVVVDDEYASQDVSVEELIGICEELSADTAATLPSLEGVPFAAEPDVWSASLRDAWAAMGTGTQAEVVRRARLLRDDGGSGGVVFGGQEDEELSTFKPELAHDVAQEPRAGESGVGYEPDTSMDVPQAPTAAAQGLSDQKRDATAALGLHELLADLPDFTFETLSLGQWQAVRDQYLSDQDQARHTLFLFDRDFRREQASDNEGLYLVREAQSQGASLCGLLTHTVSVGAEHEAWDSLSREHDLERDRFLVIAKQRLSVDGGAAPYSFLRMVRLAALSSRCGVMKNAVWKVFAESVEAAKDAMERVSVLEFDQIVLASSRREGVWEPDTLFRIFSVFMRREARRRLHEDIEADIPSKVRDAREISVIPGDDEEAYGSEPRCREAIRVHRFELFESPELLNRHHLPIDLGDIFQNARGRQFILLAQPCDLMVRATGRAYDDKCARHVTLAEVVTITGDDEPKESWEKIDWYDETTGGPVYVDFARAHDVRLAVLDLCVFNDDGKAKINVNGETPIGLIEPWQKHCQRVRKFFATAANRYKDLGKKQVKGEIKKLLLPAASLSVRFDVSVTGNVVSYEIQRVGRLLQPRAGALLTRFAQYRSRAAFEHDLDDRTARITAANEVDSACADDSVGGGAERNGD